MKHFASCTSRSRNPVSCSRASVQADYAATSWPLVVNPRTQDTWSIRVLLLTLQKSRVDPVVINLIIEDAGWVVPFTKNSRPLLPQEEAASEEGGIAMCHLSNSFVAIFGPLSTATVILVVAILGLGHASAYAQTPDSAVRYYTQGEKELRKGDWISAIEYYTKAIEISSHPVPLRRIQFDDSHSDAAASQIIVVDLFTAKAYNNRGYVYHQRGELDLAIADYDRALRIDPGLGSAYINRGVAHRFKGDLNAAMADFNRAVAIDKYSFEAFTDRGALRQIVGDLQGAIDDFNHAVKIKPKGVEAYYCRGYLLLTMKDIDGAVTDFNRAIELNPNFALAHQGRGIALLKKNQLERAITEFNRALELDSNLEFTYMNRGLTLILQGKHSDAERDFERCLKIKPALKDEIEWRSRLARDLRASAASTKKQ